MIVKEAPRRKDGKSSFTKLVNYVTDTFDKSKEKDLEQERAQPGFGRLVSYMAADLGPGADLSPEGDEKTLAVQTHRLSSLETASKEMRATAAKGRSKDPVIHWIMSWPEHEKPSCDEILDAARALLKKTGLADHQYMLAIHGNTENIHCHIAVNRVHPDTYRSHRMGWRFDAMHKAAREIEIDKDWHHDNGLFVVGIDDQGHKRVIKNPDIKLGANAFDHSTESYIVRLDAKTRDHLAWSSAGELQRYVKAHVLPDLNTAVAKAKDWQDITAVLDQHGLKLTDTGGGYQITVPPSDTQPSIRLALSKVARHIRKSDLEPRLGKLPTATATSSPTTPDLPAPPITQVETTVTTEGNNHEQQHRHRISPAGTPAAGRNRVPAMSELPLVQNIGTGEREVLLPHHVRSQLEQRGGKQNRDVRRDDDRAGPGLAPKPQTTATGKGRPSDTDYVVDLPTSKRDPEARARRREARAEERRALIETYRNDMTAVDRAARNIDERIKRVREQHRADTASVRAYYKNEKQQITANPHLSAATKRTQISLNAFERTQVLADLKARQQAELERLRALKRSRPDWRAWIEGQARAGNEAAIKALRGLVYQAGRDEAAARREVGLTSAKRAARELSDLEEREREEEAIRPRKDLRLPTAHDDLIMSQIATRLRPHVTNNGNVNFTAKHDDHLVFMDRGNKLTFDRIKVSDADLRAAMLHAAAKFGGRITLTGSDPVFKERMLRMATELNLVVLNPELRPLQQTIRAEQKAQRDRERMERKMQKQQERDSGRDSGWSR